ncbi:MAG: transporter substrate-binding domain-containing protein [Pseudomonadales bacterium]|nr:transporter substrate-binding domain-containing protein [Pseudomonadales bacterium]
MVASLITSVVLMFNLIFVPSVFAQRISGTQQVLNDEVAVQGAVVQDDLVQGDESAKQNSGAPGNDVDTVLKEFIVGVPIIGSNIVDEYVAQLQTVYIRFGFRLRVLRAPYKRLFVNGDRGMLDAIIMAPEVFRVHMKHLMQVPEPLVFSDVMAFSLHGVPEINAFSDLKDYRIGYLLAFETSEQLLKGHTATAVRTYDQLFSMLLKGRVDIALGMQREVYRFVEQQPEFRVMKMHRTPMLRVPLFHFVHEKHHDIYQPLSDAIAEKVNSSGFKSRIRSLAPKSPFLTGPATESAE